MFNLSVTTILSGIFIGIFGLIILYPGLRLFFYAIFRSFFQAKEFFEKRETNNNNDNKKEEKEED